jgi:hypothetical protein
MAKFEVTGPDGSRYEIEAPDEQTALQAFQQYTTSQNAGAVSDKPPAGAKPGSRAYADWAMKRVRSGNAVPQVSELSGRVAPERNSSQLDPFVQGVTFGWGDELRGAVQGGLAAMQGGDFGETYKREVDQSRNALDFQRRENPIGSLASELGGGIATSIAAAPLVGPLAGLGTAGRTLPLWQQMIRGGAVAIPGGAVYGAGASGDSLAERGSGALVGGAFGTAGGAVAPVVMRGIGAGVRGIANRVNSNRAARQVGMSPQAARFATETLQADDALGAGGARMAAAGDERMIADAGQSATNLLDFAIQSSGRAGRVATDAIDQRVARSSTAITKALDDALGKPQGVQSLRANIASSSAGARSAAYDGPQGAYAAPIDYASPKGRKLEELLKRLDQSDINAANNLMRAEGYQSKQIIARIGDDGTVTYQRMPDVRQIDYITRALNDRAAANAGLGALGGQTNAGRVYGNLSSDLRGATKDAVPEYETALNTAADPIRRSQAVEFGSTILRSSTTRDEVANQVFRMTPPERQAAQQGVRADIDEVLANVTRTVSDGDTVARESIAALRRLSSRASREKLALLLGQQEADQLLARVDEAATAFDLRANVANNSRTFQRQEMGRRVQQTTAPDGPLATMMRGEPLNAGKRAIQLMTGQTPEVALRQQDEIMTEVVRLLTARGLDADRALQVLQSLGGQLNSAQSVADVMRLLGERGALPAGVVTEQTRQSMAR